ncbi:hypothetical protein [Nonomuraea helvata]|uniref:Uncharacterized protein n=1 Tax=Nonomuraea helvata TaxID=37484 RepID=A0ABV5RRL6_9ACTN
MPTTVTVPNDCIQVSSTAYPVLVAVNCSLPRTRPTVSMTAAV